MSTSSTGDTDPNGDTLTPLIADQPTHGSADVNADGTVTYTPERGYKGTDSFTYRASDGDLTNNLATVTITMANAAPVAVDDTASTDTNQEVGIGVLANDTDPNPTDTLQIDAFDGTSAHGVVTQRGNLLVYTPASGFKGTDTFTYRATDGDPPAIRRRSPSPCTTKRPQPLTTRRPRPVRPSRCRCSRTTPIPTATCSASPTSMRPRPGRRIARDGDELVYTPAPGFHGADTST